jgi:phage FluMu protein Com
MVERMSKNVKLDPIQQMMVGIAGKILRNFLGEEYLKCECPTCRKLKKLHIKSEPYVKMVEKLLEEKEAKP